MSRRKVLYVCHNHPSLHPGGAETCALELYEAMRASSEFEPFFLARIAAARPHPGTPFGAVNGDPNQIFFYTDGADFNAFYLTSVNKDNYTTSLRDFLIACQPDIVHFQHTHFLGYDLIRETKNTLPNAPMIYTLHEYLPICHRHGQMLRMRNNELCRESSPRRCHECFPDISPQSFFMRKRFIESHFSLIDLFLAPSRFLLDRYVEWGLPRAKIRYEENGRRTVQRMNDVAEDRPRDRIGFFGQFNLFKGVNVLLKAMKILSEDLLESTATSSSKQSTRRSVSAQGGPNFHRENVHLWLHGANLEMQPTAFQDEFNALLEATKQNVTIVGRYDQAELPRLMADIDWVVMPSIWWENAPLVIQEAFQYGRPVICSDIGGMAEKVTDGVNGLHFRARDPASLAQTIRQAVGTPGLWERLRSGIPEVYKIEDQVVALTEMYHTLLDHRLAQR